MNFWVLNSEFTVDSISFLTSVWLFRLSLLQCNRSTTIKVWCELFKNFIPILDLAYISKIVEINYLIHSSQHVKRSFCWDSSLMWCLHNNIMLAIDSGEAVTLVLMGLSAAFKASFSFPQIIPKITQTHTLYSNLSLYTIFTIFHNIA